VPLVHRPAHVVTGIRAALAVVVAVIGPTGPGLVLVVVALVLDWVDGQVARRTGTVSQFGARFDMETDAFLIAVLSVYAAPTYGWWVLLIGAARYLLWLAERVVPWLRRPVPPRYWRKVVAAIQGIVLTVAAAGVLPHAVTTALLALALVLLAESFGREVIWLWRTKDAEQALPTPTLSRAA
jgi:phosphatidylglycerophosphate synthase